MGRKLAKFVYIIRHTDESHLTGSFTYHFLVMLLDPNCCAVAICSKPVVREST